MKRAVSPAAEQPAPDPLTALIRAAVRAELEVLRAELAAERPDGRAPARAGELLTLRETAAALRCSERHVRTLIKTGRLRAAKLATGGSSRLLIARAEIDRLLAESTHAA